MRNQVVPPNAAFESQAGALGRDPYLCTRSV